MIYYEYLDDCNVNINQVIKIERKIKDVSANSVSTWVPDHKKRHSINSIESLCTYLKHLVDARSCGVFLPQHSEYHCACEMIQGIAQKTVNLFEEQDY